MMDSSGANDPAGDQLPNFSTLLGGSGIGPSKITAPPKTPGKASGASGSAAAVAMPPPQPPLGQT
eukprot:4093060-Alexandrium_andersonii.AAC.1